MFPQSGSLMFRPQRRASVFTSHTHTQAHTYKHTRTRANFSHTHTHAHTCITHASPHARIRTQARVHTHRHHARIHTHTHTHTHTFHTLTDLFSAKARPPHLPPTKIHSTLAFCRHVLQSRIFSSCVEWAWPHNRADRCYSAVLHCS